MKKILIAFLTVLSLSLFTACADIPFFVGVKNETTTAPSYAPISPEFDNKSSDDSFDDGADRSDDEEDDLPGEDEAIEEGQADEGHDEGAEVVEDDNSDNENRD